MKTTVSLLASLALLALSGCVSDDIVTEPQNLVSCFDSASGLKCVATPLAIHYAALDVDGDGTDDPFVCADADSANDKSSALRGDGDDDEDTDGDTDEGVDDDSDEDTDEDTDGDSDSDSDSDCDSDSDSDSDTDGDSDSDSDAEGDADNDGVGNEDDCDSMVCEPDDGDVPTPTPEDPTPDSDPEGPTSDPEAPTPDAPEGLSAAGAN